jgi:hypothetical protein
MRATTFQSAKIKEVGEALVATGHVSLDEQATVLGLSRSTTWTILQASHKKNGLSASVIKRMLAQPHLPVLVRDKIYEYVDRKATGMYGHNAQQVHRFHLAPRYASQIHLSTLSLWRPRVRQRLKSPGHCAGAFVCTAPPPDQRAQGSSIHAEIA